MESLFTTTTVILTQDYTRLYSRVQLLSKLSKVSTVTGIRFSKANDTYALSGSWEQINETFELLQKWIETPDDEPVEYLSTTCSDVGQTGIGLACEAETGDSFLQQVVQGGESEVKHAENGRQSLDEVKGNKRPCNTEHLSKSSGNKASKPKRVKEVNKKSDGNTDTIMQNNISLKQTRRIGKFEAAVKKNCKSNGPRSNLKSSGDSLTGVKTRNLRATVKHHSIPDKTFYNKGKKDDLQRKKEKSDKEIVENVTVTEIEPTETTNHSCKKKVIKTPGEKGYWSRRKILDYNEKHPCAKCGVVLKSRKRYMEHMRRIHIKEFQCEVCFRRFGYPTDLNRHKCPGIPDPENKCKAKGGRPCKEKSNVPLKLPCQECDYVGTSEKRLNGHIRRNHRLTQACDMCDKKFGFVRDLERHKRSVHTKASYFCDQCSKFYKSKSVFEYHQKTHEEGFIHQKIACDICGKLFTTKYGLNAHNKMEHLGIKKEYLCQVCGKKFSQRNSYKQHMNAHNGIKPYVCGICGKGFTYHKSLKEHKYLHDNIRRFPCTLCEKTFRQRTTLQIHMQVHKTIKDHNCSRCGKGFSQKQALDRHERTHSGIKPYTCVQCQRRFGDASTIRRHMKAIHQKTDYNWREDIICNLRRKNDYYVLGGSGQNRIYKSNLKDSTFNEHNIIHSTPSTYPQKECSLSQINPVQSTGPTVLSSPQTAVNPSEYKPNYTLTQLTNLQSNPDHQSTIQTTNIYDIQPAQFSQSSLNVNYGNGAMHVVDFNNLPQSVSQLLPIRKVDMVQDSLGQLQQNHEGDLETTSLLGSSSLLPVSSIDESQKVINLNQSNTNQQHSSETTLNQTLANLWGIIGYPNLVQYQGSQNP